MKRKIYFSSNIPMSLGIIFLLSACFDTMDVKKRSDAGENEGATDTGQTSAATADETAMSSVFDTTTATDTSQTPNANGTDEAVTPDGNTNTSSTSASETQSSAGSNDALDTGGTIESPTETPSDTGTGSAAGNPTNTTADTIEEEDPDSEKATDTGSDTRIATDTVGDTVTDVDSAVNTDNINDSETGCSPTNGSVEICDEIDNDCDGETDNVIDNVCQCSEGDSDDCETHPGLDDVGQCRAGTRTCVMADDKASSYWGECVGSVGPNDEVCDSGNIDEDCDGEINEGCIVNGPCIVSPDLTNLEVFARGGDGKIYQRLIEGADTNQWSSTNLTDSTLDIASDLDCAINEGGVYIVARGNNPPGGVMFASGTGTLYNDFIRLLDTEVFVGSPSVASLTFDRTSYSIGALSSSQLRLFNFFGGDPSIYTDSNEDITSSVDISSTRTIQSTEYWFAGIAGASNELVVKSYFSSSSTYWLDPLFIAAPAGLDYEYSPSLCSEPVSGSYPHVIVVVDGKLWHAAFDYQRSSSLDWEQMAPGIEVGSAPDCVLTTDEFAHVVARTADGGVVLVQGVSGEFSITELGGY